MNVLDWQSLTGDVWNKTAFRMIGEAKELKIDNKVLAKFRNKETLTNDEQIQLIKFRHAQYIIRHELEVHAICEARERKRNAQLGLPPTVSEIQFIVENLGKEESETEFLEDI